MGIENVRYAAVNLSSTKIPVYEKRVHSGIHTGLVTVGGNIIGHIFQYEFYIVLPNISSTIYTPSSYQIYFRDANKQCRYGYIETSPGTTLGYYAWNAQQHPYMYYNSNESKLVESNKATINGNVHRIFTVNRAVKYRAINGTLLGTLPAGTQLATNSSTTGMNYTSYMVFFYKRASSTSSWTKLDPNGNYAFVDLDIANGNMPYDRSIR